MHWVLQCLDSYYCLLCRCAVTVTISEHQWEVAVCCSRPSVVSCVIGNTHQLIRWRQYREYGQRLSSARYVHESNRLSGSDGW